MASIYDYKMKAIDGNEKSLGDFRDKVLLVVNVASKCGLTPQYEGLEKLQKSYEGRGFTVVGFPCNQFAGQEPGTDAQVQEFCSLNYGVTFPLFSKIEVNGAGRAPLYKWLTETDTKPDGSGDIKWNFAKFLIDRKGQVAARFSPTVTPEDPELTKAIEQQLG